MTEICRHACGEATTARLPREEGQVDAVEPDVQGAGSAVPLLHGRNERRRECLRADMSTQLASAREKNGDDDRLVHILLRTHPEDSDRRAGIQVRAREQFPGAQVRVDGSCHGGGGEGDGGRGGGTQERV